MDLWIRSQDKEVLLKCNQVYYFELNGKNIIATDLELVQRGYDYQPLGYYKTKERALEVLDEIQNRLVKLSALNIIGLPNEQVAHSFIKLLEEENIKELRVVYEMPQE